MKVNWYIFLINIFLGLYSQALEPGWEIENNINSADLTKEKKGIVCLTFSPVLVSVVQ